MATVLVKFDGGNVPVVTGPVPPNSETPISNPLLTGFTTNQAFRVEAGLYCLGLDIVTAYAPLWQVVQAVDGIPVQITFRRTKGNEAIYRDIDPPNPWPRRK